MCTPTHTHTGFYVKHPELWCVCVCVCVVGSWEHCGKVWRARGFQCQTSRQPVSHLHVVSRGANQQDDSLTTDPRRALAALYRRRCPGSCWDCLFQATCKSTAAKLKPSTWLLLLFDFIVFFLLFNQHCIFLSQITNFPLKLLVSSLL